MKIVGQDSCIHVVDDNTAAWQVLKDITESGAQDDAFYVVDVDEIVRRHKNWMQYLPRVEPHFAIKCNDTNVAVSVMAALGTGFDCASKMEIHKILKLGVDPRRIIFANPTKQMSHIRYAMTCGVDLMTFDNQDELNKIKAIYPTARLVLRIRCDSTKATYPLGSKAGAEMEDVEDILTVARELDLNVIGVSFHVGSGCSDPPVYVRGVQLAHSVFQTASKLGFNFTLLNVGGGFPGKIGSSIIEYADLINSALNIYFPEGDGIRFIAEPGRYFVESAYTLATCIHSRRLTRNKNGENIYMYYINDGIYGSFNGRIFDNAGSVATPVPLKVSSTEPQALNG
ncbi:hypothetical protein B566_EDAN002429 [Ephemera danica]|nr:hypothetical protein B566_EDAN002429 [Ephemera danica]